MFTKPFKIFKRFLLEEHNSVATSSCVIFLDFVNYDSL